MSSEDDYEHDRHEEWRRSISSALVRGRHHFGRVLANAEAILVHMQTADEEFFVEFPRGRVNIQTVLHNLMRRNMFQALQDVEHWWVVGIRDDVVIAHDHPNFHCLVLHSERVFRGQSVLRLSESDNLVFRLTPNYRRPGRGRNRQRLNHEAEQQRMEHLGNQHHHAQNDPAVVTDDELSSNE